MKKVFLALAFVFVAIAVQAQQLSGRDIMKKVDERPDGETRYAQMELTLVKKNGSKRERKMESWAMDIGKDTKKIMYFTYPGDVKGTGFLTWDYDQIGKEDDKWLYLPAIKKTRRISGSSAKQDYFMGSDFTYDDMGSRNVDEDTHTLLGEETVDGQKCWKLESLPKDKRDIYSRKTALIRQDCLIPVRVEYYDKMGKLHRRLEMSDIAKVEGFWVARKMHMTNVQTEHQTVLEIKNPTYNIPMEESKFNVTTLEKGRF